MTIVEACPAATRLPTVFLALLGPLPPQPIPAAVPGSSVTANLCSLAIRRAKPRMVGQVSHDGLRGAARPQRLRLAIFFDQPQQFLRDRLGGDGGVAPMQLPP